MSTTRAPDDQFDVDTKVFVLSSVRRRRLISIVAEHDEISLSEASKIIAADGTDDDPEDIEYDDRHSVYIQLWQNHVPKLVESNIIEESDNVLSATEFTQKFDELITTLDEFEIGGARA